MEELCVWKFVCSSLLCVGVEVCALKFVKEMWVTKLRVKELCSSLCERVVCVLCMKALCVELCMCSSLRVKELCLKEMCVQGCV